MMSRRKTWIRLLSVILILLGMYPLLFGALAMTIAQGLSGAFTPEGPRVNIHLFMTGMGVLGLVLIVDLFLDEVGRFSLSGSVARGGVDDASKGDP